MNKVNDAMVNAAAGAYLDNEGSFGDAMRAALEAAMGVAPNIMGIPVVFDPSIPADTFQLVASQPVRQEPVAFAVESPAFEAHAKGAGLNMEQHPLHYLFLDEKTYAARQAWKAALQFSPPAQAVDLEQVREIRIPARNKLDPISVFVQDQAPGRGRIVVTCYGNAWQGFWNAMGDRTVMQFVARCDAYYVAGSLLQGRQTRIAKHEREYVERVAAEVIAEFRSLIDGQSTLANVTPPQDLRTQLGEVR